MLAQTIVKQRFLSQSVIYLVSRPARQIWHDRREAAREKQNKKKYKRARTLQITYIPWYPRSVPGASAVVSLHSLLYP